MKVCVAHYPEGAGHATRMLSIAKEIENHGHEIKLAGGGPGKKFVEVNGYSEYVPTEVNFVEAYQEEGLFSTLKNMVKSYHRTHDLMSWYSKEDPDIIVADGLFASLAAILGRRKFHYVNHNAGFLYEDTGERIGAWGWNQLITHFAEKHFHISVWNDEEHLPRNAEREGPVALEVENQETPEVDILVVPSAFSKTNESVKKELEKTGRDVTWIGDENWETQPSLQPFIESANLVICTGYSTVMEAAVAGTPCIIIPEMSEQRGVVRTLEKEDIKGFKGVYDTSKLLEAIESVEQPKKHQNYARSIAEEINDIEVKKLDIDS